MGIGNSTLNSQVIDKVEFKLDGQTDDMEKMMTQLKFLIEVHTSRKNTFDKVKTNTTQYEIEKDFLEQLLKSYEDSKDQENILYLYNIGALYNEKVGATSKVLKFHPKFENVYSTFLDNLNSLILINKSELSSNANVVNSSDLSNMRDKTKLKLNNILARVLFYAYAIAYNNYLMYIYSMYAEKQFKAMDLAGLEEKYVTPGNSYNNQFQMPRLFMMFVLFALQLELVDTFFILASYLFVALRYVHAYIHLTYNNVLHRLLCFTTSSLILFVCWGRLVILAS